MAGRALTILASVVILGAIVGVYLINKAPTREDGERTARTLVEAFGATLKNVSLTADKTLIVDAMQREYAPYVAPTLLSVWQNDPSQAPGRHTSSPWPDRIEIVSIDVRRGIYEVQGDIVEVSNEGGGINEEPTVAARRPITMTLQNLGFGLRITALTLGAYPGDGNWHYTEPNAQGIQFMYPDTLPTTFISAAQWPPEVVLEGGDYSCAEEQELMIDDRAYCVVQTSEGAAGSMYTTYEYITAQGDFLARVKFTLKFPQCMNYPEPNQSACKAEQSSFDINGLADRIAQSTRMQ